MEKSFDRGPNALSVALRPVVIAYLLGYLSSAGPKLVQVLIQLLLHKRSPLEAVFKIKNVLRQAASLNRLAAFCGTIVAGSTLLQPPIRLSLNRLSKRSRLHGLRFDSAQLDIATKFLAAFSGALLSFTLLNAKSSADRLPPHTGNYGERTVISNGSQGTEAGTPNIKRPRQFNAGSDVTKADELSASQRPLAGRSMDFTLFAVTRATDAVVATLWVKLKSRRAKAKSLNAAKTFAGQIIDPAVFAVSCSIIMWSWFYSPDRLPRTYNSWISSAAEVDERLIKALREARYGNFVYGKDTGIAPLLQAMCEDYDWPLTWGDPAKTIPIPCEMVHMGTGPNCEKHAIARFCRAWFFALRMYLPLNLLMLARRRNLTKGRVLKSFSDACRNSAFLGAFVALFYYGVCLARTRLGPRVFSRKTVSPMQWDSGLCVSAGCLLCGWSVLLEKPSRRQELACFVAPRALATVFPRRYDRKHQWKERLVFAFSAASVLTAAQLKPERVRGVFGGLLHQILTSSDPVDKSRRFASRRST